MFLIKFIRHNLQQRTLENITYTSSKFVDILRLANHYKSAGCAEQQLSKTRLAAGLLHSSLAIVHTVRYTYKGKDAAVLLSICQHDKQNLVTTPPDH